MRLSIVILFIILFLAWTPTSQAQQSVGTQLPQVKMYLLHQERQHSGYLQIFWFEDAKNECYVMRESATGYGGYGVGGGISCLRK